MPFRNFGKYKNRVFVETGTYLGDGVRAAVAAGFEKIISIEINKELAEKLRFSFHEVKKVTIYCMDSRNLYKVIEDINEPITFWLDGHYSGEGTGYGAVTYPIIEELKQIEKHPIKTHTILIDDMRLVETEWGLKMVDVLHWIYKINPAYKITYEDGYIANDVLVARVE